MEVYIIVIAILIVLTVAALFLAYRPRSMAKNRSPHQGATTNADNCPRCDGARRGGERFCPGCGAALTPEGAIASDETRPSYPGVLWLLPVFFGLFGGVVAALIANLKYEAKWWELVLVGFIVSFLEALAWMFFVGLAFLSL